MFGIGFANNLWNGRVSKSHVNKRGTDDSAQNVTWMQLKAILSEGKAVTGAPYAIVNFTDDLGGTPGVDRYIRPQETLIVYACSSNEVANEAFSPSFPEDVILYNFDLNRIIYREDTTKELSAYYDWRNVKHRKWEGAVGNSVYTSYSETAPQSYPGMTYKQNGGDPYIEITGGDFTSIIQIGATGKFTNNAAFNPAKNFTVIQVVYDVGEGSTLVSLTWTNTTQPNDNTTGLVEINARYKDFYTFGNDLIFDETNGWAGGIMDPAPDGNGGTCKQIRLGTQDEVDSAAAPYLFGAGTIIGNGCNRIRLLDDVNLCVVANETTISEIGSSNAQLRGGGMSRITIGTANNPIIGWNSNNITILNDGNNGVTIGKSCSNIMVIDSSEAVSVPDNTAHKIYSIPESYKSYACNLTQSAAGNPQPGTPMKNTLGGSVSFTRDSAGSYSCTSPGLFTVGKTQVFCSGGIGGLFYAYIDNANLIQLGTTDMAGTPLDGMLNTTSFEIRVYP